MNCVLWSAVVRRVLIWRTCAVWVISNGASGLPCDEITEERKKVRKWNKIERTKGKKEGRTTQPGSARTHARTHARTDTLPALDGTSHATTWAHACCGLRCFICAGLPRCTQQVIIRLLWQREWFSVAAASAVIATRGTCCLSVIVSVAQFRCYVRMWVCYVNTDIKTDFTLFVG